MSLSRYDAIVVGAGPGGSAAAASLAARGARVMLIDRSHFPRDKACGGGLTPRGVHALERIGVPVKPPAFVEVTGLAMSAGNRSAAVGFPRTSRWPVTGAVARRVDLDAAVLERAADAGASVRTGVRAIGPVIEDGACRGVRVLESGRRVEYVATHTIAADGATSVLARGAGLASASSSGKGFWYAAMRGYFGPVAPREAHHGPVLEFYPLRDARGRWLPGYGWVFPLPDGAANVGVDLPHRPAHRWSPPLRAAYDTFVENLRRSRPGFAEAREEAAPVGALLPEGMAGIRPAMPGLLLVGDAAGLISPYSGEGIAYALESAELAASAVLTHAAGAAARAYEAALRSEYGFQFRAALRFMKAVRRPPLARVAARFGLAHPRILRAAVRVMAFLVDDDPPSTVSALYGAARRLYGPRP